MKRLTFRYKKWLMYRQRYASNRRIAFNARHSRAPSARKIKRIYTSVQKLAEHLAYQDSFYVVWAYSLYLQNIDFKIPDDIEVAPQFLQASPPQTLLAEWTLEQIVREVIQHGDECNREGRRLRQWRTLAEIANALRDLEGEIYRHLVGAKKIHLEMMRISHRQFVWQQQYLNWRWMVRYHKLFNTPPLNEMSLRATGLTIRQIHLIGMGYLAIFLEKPFAAKKIKVEVPGLTDRHIELFLQFASLGLAQLRNRVRAEHTLDEGFAYQYSSLREFPLIHIPETGAEEIACPIPTLLFWRITTGLYYALKDEEGFSEAIGHSFQDYVGQVLNHRISNGAMQVLCETEYQIGKNRKDTVDWIIQQGDENAIFVECKSKRLTWASKAKLTDPTSLKQDIQKLAGAVVQVYRTINDYRDGWYPQLPFCAKRRIYPLIVTLEDWYFFGHELPVRLENAVKETFARAKLPVDWLEEMPYSIMSVDEFETAAGVINTTDIRAFISGKVKDPKFHYWGYAAYCNDRHPDAVRNLLPLFDDEYNTMFADLSMK
jgi:hypothetical protein